MQWMREWMPPGRGDIVKAWHLDNPDTFMVQVGDQLHLVDRDTLILLIERTGVWTLNTDG